MSSLLSYFPDFLFFTTLICGIFWGIEKWRWAPQRKEKTADTAPKRPRFLEYTADVFPILFIIFFLRFFIVEPFKIPSSSMRPGLEPGDLIAVNRFAYGVRIPLLNTRILGSATPQRGDVVVFKFPKNQRIDYIKRVIGVPGDTIIYQNKKLTINGSPLQYDQLPNYIFKETFDGEEHDITTEQWQELFPGTTQSVSHKIATFPPALRSVTPPEPDCVEMEGNGFKCLIPPGRYFVMGDNRDNSLDSRYWGFVSDDLLVGRAFAIWMNFSDMSRIGGIR